MVLGDSGELLGKVLNKQIFGFGGGGAASRSTFPLVSWPLGQPRYALVVLPAAQFRSNNKQI